VRRRGLAAIAIALAGLFGCAPFNAKLEAIDPARPGYRLARVQPGEPPDARDRIFVVVTLSGGGTRAAAFAYGALAGLRDLRAPIDGRIVSLLSEVDVVSSVSGGSFAAAYYGAFGPDAFFAHFQTDVLNRRLESAIAWRVVAPWNWPRLWSPYFSRTDLAAAYYDRAIFHHRTYAALPERPLIVMNATDLSAGAPFAFLQDSFDALCSDLAPLPLATAVTASSAFPVAFPPLTLRNWNAAGDCGYVPSKAIENAVAGGAELNAHDYERAKERLSFTDPARAYLHLSDGGIADNLGLRGVLAGLVSSVPDLPLLQRVNLDRIDKLVVISVDAKPGVSTDKDAHRGAPGIFTVTGRAASAPMGNYSTDSVAWLKSAIEGDATQVNDLIARRAACDELFAGETERKDCYERFAAGGDRMPHCFDFYGVHVQFENAPPDIKKRLMNVDTRLQLPRKDVALLIAEGRRQVGASKELARLVRDLEHPKNFPCPSVPDD